MILSVISSYISIDKLQKEDEKKYVHFLSRPVDFLADLDNWNSTIYTTKSIARAVIIKHPGTLHLFRIVECNRPFDIKVDGKSCTVTMFENSGLSENLAIYFKGENCTVLYTACFTRCRALLCNKLLHHYVLKGIDVMYVDNTAVRSRDPVSVYSASAEILQIAKKYPDHQIIMSVPPFGYEDLIFSLANAAKMKVFVEGAHLFAFEKQQISDIFEQDSQKATVIVNEEEEMEVTLEVILRRFVEKKIITLRILLCELPPKNCYENIGLFEVNWSPHPSLSEIYTLVNYIDPKSVREINSSPKLPLFVKKESKDTNNSVAVNFQVPCDASGRSTPVSEIEELSAPEFCNNTHNYKRKGRKEINFQSQFDSFTQNNIVRPHNSAWKYCSLPKRILHKAKRDHQKNTKVELNRSKAANFSIDFLSVSTFSSSNSSVERRKDQHADICQSRESKENKRAHLISSTPSRDRNDHQAKPVGSDKDDLLPDFSSMSTFSSLSSVESDFNLSDQINGVVSRTTDAPRTDIVQAGQIVDKAERVCTKSIRNKSKKSTEAHLGKRTVGSDKDDSMSISTFSSLFSSVENDLNLTGKVSGLNASRTAAVQSRKMGDISYKDCANPKSTTRKEDGKGNQAKAVIMSETTENPSSYELPSMSTFSSLSISPERNNLTISRTNISVSQESLNSPANDKSKQSEKKTLQNEDIWEKNKSKGNNKCNQAKAVIMGVTTENPSSYELPSMSTFSSLSISPERNNLTNSRINISVSQESLNRPENDKSKQCDKKTLQNQDISEKYTSKGNNKGNQAKGLNMNANQGNRRSSYEFPSIPTAVERNSMWNDLINVVVSQIDISSPSIEKRLDNLQSNQGEEALYNEDTSIKSTSGKNKRGSQNKAVVCSNEFQQSYQSSISTFTSLSSPDDSSIQLNDEINKVMTKTQVKFKSITAKDRTKNRYKRGKRNADNIRNKQSEQKGWKRSGKSPKTSKIVRQAKTGNQVNELKGDHLSGTTISSFNQINEIMSQLHIQKPHKIVGTYSGIQGLPQIRRQSAETVQNKQQKVEKDEEDDAQVVPNVFDGIDSDTSEEFNSSNMLLFDGTLSVSTFTSLSLSSLSDERPTPVKSRKLSNKKKQPRKMSKPRRLETERTSGNYSGQSKEAE